MEGFLWKKGGNTNSKFSRRSWKKRWFVLDKRTLKYFEDFDRVSGKPTKLRKSVELTENSDARVTVHKERVNVFIIEIPERSSLLLFADDERTMRCWITALKQAIGGDFGPPNYSRYFSLLGLDEQTNPDLADVNRAYRKAALRAHPDKGGDILEFKKLQEALEMLTSHLEDEQNRKQYDEVEFNATIQKGAKGVGFGMVVVEDAKRGFIYVKDVLPTIKLEAIDDVADGGLRSGDRLIGVGNDDVREWSLNRVIQRMSDFRVPVNTSVRIRFMRKVEKSEPVEDNVVESHHRHPQSHQHEGRRGEARNETQPESLDEIDEGDYYNNNNNSTSTKNARSNSEDSYRENVTEDDDKFGEYYPHANKTPFTAKPHSWDGKPQHPGVAPGQTPLKSSAAEDRIFLEKENALLKEKLRKAELSLVAKDEEISSLQRQLNDAKQREEEVQQQLAKLKLAKMSSPPQNPTSKRDVDVGDNNASNIMPGTSHDTVKIRHGSSSGISSGIKPPLRSGGLTSSELDAVRSLQRRLSKNKMDLDSSSLHVDTSEKASYSTPTASVSGAATGSRSNPNASGFTVSPRSVLKQASSATSISKQAPGASSGNAGTTPSVNVRRIQLPDSDDSPNNIDNSSSNSVSYSAERRVNQPSNYASSLDNRRAYMASAPSSKTLKPSSGAVGGASRWNSNE